MYFLTIARSIINQPVPRAAVALVTDRQVDADLPAPAVVLQAFVHAAKRGALVFPADAVPILVAHLLDGDARALAAFELSQRVARLRLARAILLVAAVGALHLAVAVQVTWGRSND